MQSRINQFLIVVALFLFVTIFLIPDTASIGVPQGTQEAQISGTEVATNQIMPTPVPVTMEIEPVPVQTPTRLNPTLQIITPFPIETPDVWTGRGTTDKVFIHSAGVWYYADSNSLENMTVLECPLEHLLLSVLLKTNGTMIIDSLDFGGNKMVVIHGFPNDDLVLNKVC